MIIDKVNYLNFLNVLMNEAIINGTNELKKNVIIRIGNEFNIKDYRVIFNDKYKSDKVVGYYKIPVTNAESAQMIDEFELLLNEKKPRAPRVVKQVDLQDSNVTEEPVKKVAPVSFLSVPVEDPNYIKWGHFNDVLAIAQSNSFYPVFIWGDSGNGKTMMIEQACAIAGRSLVRVNITEETDEDDLIGGYRITNGNMVWQDGPVVVAMKNGGVVLLDELDRGTDKLMCIQAILEGGKFAIKKTGEVVVPAEGFNIIATANTQGRGSDSGKFNARILDEAFLERFVETFTQQYPTSKIEMKILIGTFRKYGKDILKNADKAKVDSMIVSLVEWANDLRNSYKNGVIDSCISTRRLVFIIRSFCVYGNLERAIVGCTSRFDEANAKAMIDLYSVKFPSKVTKSSFMADTNNAVPSPDDFGSI